jgi:protein-tyrosine phosphatase
MISHTAAAVVLVIVSYCVVEKNITGAHACRSLQEKSAPCATIKMFTTQQQQFLLLFHISEWQGWTFMGTHHAGGYQDFG